MPTESHVDYYAVLGIPPDAKDEKVRAAYKVMVHRYQRGRLAGTPDDLRQRMADAARAYEVLIDPVRRRRYDLHRRIDESAERLASRSGAAAQIDAPVHSGRWRRPGRAGTISAALVLLALLACLTWAVFEDRSSEGPAASVMASPPAPPAPPEAALESDDANPASPAPQPNSSRHASTTPSPAVRSAASAVAPPAKAAPAKRAATTPRDTPPTRPEPTPQECTEVVSALGFCNRNSTRKDS